MKQTQSILILLILITITLQAPLMIGHRNMLLEVLSKSNMAVIFYGDQNSTEYKEYQSIIPSQKELFSDLQFYFLPALKSIKDKPTPLLQIYRKIQGGQWISYKGIYTSNLMGEWVRKNTYDSLQELLPTDYNIIFEKANKGLILLDYGEFSLLRTKILINNHCAGQQVICRKCSKHNVLFSKIVMLMQAQEEVGVSKLGYYDPKTKKFQIFSRKNIQQLQCQNKICMSSFYKKMELQGVVLQKIHNNFDQSTDKKQILRNYLTKLTDIHNQINYISRYLRWIQCLSESSLYFVYEHAKEIDQKLLINFIIQYTIQIYSILEVIHNLDDKIFMQLAKPVMEKVSPIKKFMRKRDSALATVRGSLSKSPLSNTQNAALYISENLLTKHIIESQFTTPIKSPKQPSFPKPKIIKILEIEKSKSMQAIELSPQHSQLNILNSITPKNSLPNTANSITPPIPDDGYHCEKKLLKIIGQLHQQIRQLRQQNAKLLKSQKNNKDMKDIKKFEDLKQFKNGKDSKVQKQIQQLKIQNTQLKNKLKIKQIMYKKHDTSTNDLYSLLEEAQKNLLKFKDQNKSLRVQLDFLQRKSFITSENIKKNNQQEVSSIKDKYVKLLEEHRILTKNYHEMSLKLKRQQKKQHLSNNYLLQNSLTFSSNRSIEEKRKF